MEFNNNKLFVAEIFKKRGRYAIFYCITDDWHICLADANGYGYKSSTNAKKAMWFLSQKKDGRFKEKLDEFLGDPNNAEELWKRQSPYKEGDSIVYISENEEKEKGQIWDRELLYAGDGDYVKLYFLIGKDQGIFEEDIISHSRMVLFEKHNISRASD